MNSRIKDLIGIISILSVLFFAYTAWVYVDAFSKSIEPSSFRSFQVSAEGEVAAIPDVAQFTFSVITQGGTDIANVQEKNVEKTNRAINFVKAQGVEDKDVKTQNFNLTPRYQHFNCPRSLVGQEPIPCPPSEIVGYSMTQTVLIKVRDFTKIGVLVSGVVENGANSVSQLFFTIDDRDAIESEARSIAIAKAREKAGAVAQAGGFSVGRLLSIQESGAPFFSLSKRVFDSGIGEAVPALAPTPSIEPGSEQVKVNVTLVYEIR